MNTNLRIQTVFHPSEVELADTITAILEQGDATRPQRVVFDSLSELRMLARDPGRSGTTFSILIPALNH